MAPIPTVRITPDTSSVLLNKDLDLNVMIKNSSSTASDIGYKMCADIFVEKGLLNQTTGSQITTVGEWKDYTNPDTLVTAKDWVDDTGALIVEHPYASSGLPIPTAPDANKHWRWYLVKSAYSSYAPAQPEVSIFQNKEGDPQAMSFKADKADGAAINVPLSVYSDIWFRYGTNEFEDTEEDPPIQGTRNSATVTPTLIEVTKTNDKPEAEVASGPNFPVTYSIKVDIAEGEVVDSIVVKDVLSKDLLLFDPDTSNGSSNMGDVESSNHSTSSRSVYSVSRSAVDSRKNLTIPATDHGLSEQSLTWTVGSFTGSSGDVDLEFKYKAYASYKNIDGDLILSKSVDSEKVANEDVRVDYTHSTVPGGAYVTDDDILTIKQLCIQKSASSPDSPVIPLSKIDYEMNIQVSDFFDLDELRITDTLSDGTYLSSAQQNISNFTFYYRNNQVSGAVVQGDLTITDSKSSLVTDVTGSNNSDTYADLLDRYTIAYDLDNLVESINSTYYSITDNNLKTKAKGGLIFRDNSYADPYPENVDQSKYNYDQRNASGYELTIKYEATVDQLYYGRTSNLSSMDNDYNKIDILDFVDSSIIIDAKNCNWESNSDNYYETASVPNVIQDDSSTKTTIGSISIAKTIYAITRDGVVHDTNAAEAMHLQSQDLVTYRVKIDLSHQNFRNFRLEDYVPLPVMKTASISSDINTAFDDSAPDSNNPAVNIIKYGPDHTFYDASDTAIFKHPQSIAVDNDSNGFVLNWQNFQMPYYAPNGSDVITHKIGSKSIDLLYTILATDRPTVDGLKLTNQAVYYDDSTTGSSKSENDFTSIRIDQPELEIAKGIVAIDSVDSDTTISGSSDISVTYADSGFTTNDTVDFETTLGYTVTNLNRGDDTKYAIIVRNTGSDKAFSVAVSDDQAVDDSNNTNITIDTTSIEVYNGEGTAISVSQAEKDKLITTGMNIGDIPGSYLNDSDVLVDDEGNATTQAKSMRIIIYKARVLERDSLIVSNQSICNTGYIESYTNHSAGQNFTEKYAVEGAKSDVSMKNVSITRKIIWNSEDPSNSSTRGSDNITIGELYRIRSTIEIPLGSIDDLILRDEIDFRDSNSTNCGMEILKSTASLDSGSPIFYDGSNNAVSNSATHVSSAYSSTDINDDSYYYDSNQYRYAALRKITNTSVVGGVMEPTVIIVDHVGRATDDSHSDTKKLGESGITTSHETRSRTKMTVLSNTTTVKSSGNTTLNIKEPVVNITKEFDSSSATDPAKSDNLVYIITVTASNYKAYDVVIGDTFVSDITPTEVREDAADGTVLSLPTVYNSGSRVLTLNVGDLDSAEKKYYVTASVDAYRTGDSLDNTANVDYNSLSSSVAYSVPNDNVLDGVSLSNVYRMYQDSDVVSVVTYPVVQQTLTNETYSHADANSNVAATVGDTMQSMITLTIPNGTTHVKEITLTYPYETSNVDSLILSTDSIASSSVTFGPGLTYDDGGSPSTDLTLTPSVFGNSTIFAFDKVFTNDSGSSTTLSFPYTYVVKNHTNNVRGADLRTSVTMAGYNTSLTRYDRDGGNSDFTIVEPKMSIDHTLLHEAVVPGDTFKVRSRLNVEGRSDSAYSTLAFKPSFYLDVSSAQVDTSQTVIESASGNVNMADWTVDTSNDSRVTVSYTPTGDAKLNEGDYDFNVTFKTLNNATGDSISNASTVNWASQLSYVVDEGTPESYDNVRYFETPEVGSYQSRLNNYVVSDSIVFRIKPDVETYRLGVSFEDALDFDYDYEDVVLNVIYRYYRNKNGIKRFMADFHIVARGAAYDHTLGAYFDGLKTNSDGSTRSGSWRVVQFTGHDNQVTDNREDIMTYLDKATNTAASLSALREDCIPLFISTQAVMPADAAKPDNEFSTNTHDRTDDVKEWVAPASVRLVVDFDEGSEIKDDVNSQLRTHFLPYIDVRGPGNDKVDPRYNDYEYRHYLGSTVDVSFKTFTHDSVQSTYTAFPKVLITPVDFKNKADYGEIANYYPLIEVYPDFIDYVTSDQYPSTSSMKRMELIDERWDEVKLSDSWANNSATVRTDRMMKTKTTEYDAAGVSGVLDKELMNQYHTRNMMRCGPTMSHCTDVRQLIANSASHTEELLVTDFGSESTQTISAYRSANADSRFVNIDCNSSGVIACITNSAATSSTGGSSVLTSSTTFDSSLTSVLNSSNIRVAKLGRGSDATKIVAIDDSYTIQTNLAGDHSAHNASSRQVYDAVIFNSCIVSIGMTNDLVVTGSNSANVNTSGIVDPIQLTVCASNMSILTAANEVYVLDVSNGQTQVLSGKTITDVRMTDTYLVGLEQGSDTSYVHSVKLSDNAESANIRSNVAKFDCYDYWMVSVLRDGRVVMDLLDGAQTLPDIAYSIGSDGIQYIDGPTITDSIVDVRAYKDSVLVNYI